MIGRPVTALALAFALIGVLTVTAFAVSLPSVSAPQARDLPRIVSDVPVSAAVATLTADAAPSAPKTSTVSPSGAGSASGGATGDNGSASSGTGGSQASRDPDHDGDDDAKNPDESSEHEVVKVRLHESDDRKSEGGGISIASKIPAAASIDGGRAAKNRYSH